MAIDSMPGPALRRRPHAYRQRRGEDDGIRGRWAVARRSGAGRRAGCVAGRARGRLQRRHSSEGEQPALADIVAVCDKLRSEGYEPVVVVDAALRHQIDDRTGYERLVDEGHIRQAPAGTDADYFILSFARELDASIVSNDRFRDRQKAFPEASRRLIRYMVVKGEVVFERRTGRRGE